MQGTLISQTCDAEDGFAGGHKPFLDEATHGIRREEKNDGHPQSKDQAHCHVEDPFRQQASGGYPFQIRSRVLIRKQMFLNRV